MPHNLVSFLSPLSPMPAAIDAIEITDQFTKSELMAALAILGVVLFVVVCLVVLTISARWKMFKKAGQPGWASVIPFYSAVKTLELTNYPLWWSLLMVVPIVNIFLMVVVLRRLATAFGKGAWFTIGLIFLPFIFYPILAWGKAEYSNSFPPAKPMSEAVKYALLSGFAFVLVMGCMNNSSSPRSERFDHYYSDIGQQEFTDMMSELQYAPESTTTEEVPQW